MTNVDKFMFQLGFKRLEKVNSVHWNFDIVAKSGWIATFHPPTGKIFLSVANRLERGVSRLQHHLKAGIMSCVELQDAFTEEPEIVYYVRVRLCREIAGADDLLIQKYYQQVESFATPVGRFAKSKKTAMSFDQLQKRVESYVGKRFNPNISTMARAVTVDGVTYASIREARLALGLSHYTALKRFNSTDPEWVGWAFV